MDAAPTTEERGTPATITVRFNDKLFDARCVELGLEGEDAKAEHGGVDRSTLWRYRNGATVPNVRDAAQFAHRFGLTSAELWQAVSV